MRSAAPLAIALGLGAVAGYALVPPRPGDWISKDLSADVVLDEMPISKKGEVPNATLLKAATDAALRRAEGPLQEKVTLVLAEKRLERTRRELGLELDRDDLLAQVQEALDPRSPRWRHRTHLGSLPITPRYRVDLNRAVLAISPLKDEYDIQAADAIVDIKKKEVAPEKPGRELVLADSLTQLEKGLLAMDKNLSLVTRVVEPRRTVEAVKAIDASDVIGYFQTHYMQGPDYQDRVFNLRRAASKVDGTVLFPGETFDFNEVVGPRTEGNGFRVATMIARGELVDGLGGGTCQIAGTLHAAAFFSGLEIVERHPHTRPSFYIKMGLDAAVAYPTITLRIRNPFPFPVVFRESVEDGWVRAEVTGPKRTREVAFLRKVVAAKPFRERELKEPTLAKGEKVLYQRGIPGFKVVRYRVIYDGNAVRREKYEDSYPSTAQIWKVGTRDDEKGDEKSAGGKEGAIKEPKRPKEKRGKGSRSMLEADDPSEPTVKEDKHPEYVADEYLEVRQGPNVPYAYDDQTKKGGGTLETRVAGKYGSYGWQEREGFAKSADPKREE